MEIDYSSEVEVLVPQCVELGKARKVSDALDKLLAMEKQTRQAADAHSTSLILVAAVRVCFDAGEWSLLNEHIVLLTKRRTQLKQAVTKMIQEACTYVDAAPDSEKRVKLIETLRTVTEGKIYVEVERARLTRRLAKMREDDGDVAGAAKILQDLQVETFGSMEKREKVEFILEQMRLCLANDDFVRTQIISKKISVRFFETAADVHDLKLKYYELMIRLGEHDDSFLAMSKHFQAVCDTGIISEDPGKRQEALKNVVLCLLLSHYDNEQSDLVHRTSTNKFLEEIPTYRELLKLFITMELIDWTKLCSAHETELRRGTDASPATRLFSSLEARGDARWEIFHKRVIEHNIRVIAKYYSRISLARMSELLCLSTKEVEESLSSLVVDKTVHARTDRPGGIVSFQAPEDPNQVLNAWSRSLDSLMALVNKTTHLVTKEEMVHSTASASGVVH
ncbi:26S proteasome non-ATPase regulatory subunit 12-like isoform X1 [Oscarella lobularis]